jgi:RimJ/RimL family protein N-acetyltransferase
VQGGQAAGEQRQGAEARERTARGCGQQWHDRPLRREDVRPLNDALPRALRSKPGGAGGLEQWNLDAPRAQVPDDGRMQADLSRRPLAAVAWPVHTERLAIRPATLDDAGPTWRIRSLPGVSEWLTSDAGDRVGYVERFADPGRLAKTLVAEHDGALVGDLMISVEDAWAQSEVAEQARGVQAELGWVIDPSYAGRGLATEAARALLRICFEELGLRRVTANCFAANTASWRLMEKLGMRRELHTVRESLHRSGEWLDGYGYALLAEEWRSS